MCSMWYLFMASSLSALFTNDLYFSIKLWISSSVKASSLDTFLSSYNSFNNSLFKSLVRQLQKLTFSDYKQYSFAQFLLIISLTSATRCLFGISTLLAEGLGIALALLAKHSVVSYMCTLFRGRLQCPPAWRRTLYTLFLFSLALLSCQFHSHAPRLPALIGSLLSKTA